MAGGLPPPPTKDAAGSFAWVDYFNRLNSLLNTSGAVPWSLVNKAGSNLSEIQTRLHASLQSVLGTGQYHISASEQANVTALPTAANIVVQAFKTKAGIPSTTDITAGNWAIYKDTSGGTLKLYANDGGVIKSVALV